MSNYVVDNKELIGVADAVKRMTEQLNKDAEYLRDEKSDVFNRYMSYNKLIAVLKGLEAIMSLCKSSMISGHNLNDEMFHTEAGKGNGWDEFKIFDHPFFMDEDEKDEDGEMPDLLKKLLESAVLGAIFNRASNDKKE